MTETVTVTAPKLDAIVTRFDQMPGHIRSALRAAVTGQAIDMERAVKEEKLSGQVLGQRTRRLRNSIFQRVVENDAQILGLVGANMAEAKYAAFHEYGFHGTESVRAHLRQRTVLFREIKFTPRGRLRRHRNGEAMGKTVRLPDGAPIEVRAHERHVEYDGRSYLRSTLAERAPTIRAALEAAIRNAVAP